MKFKIDFNGKYVQTNTVPTVKGSVILLNTEILCSKELFTKLETSNLSDKEEQEVQNFLNKVKK